MKKIWFVVPIILLVGIILIIFYNFKNNNQKVVNQTNMKIFSPAFQNNETIPSRYTCDGENINPPLYFEEIPPETKSLVLIVDDPDAPMGNFLHWLVFNIPAETKLIEENSVPVDAKLGKNDFGKLSYGGPCPPYGIHRYYFRLFALDTTLDLPEGVSREEVLAAIRNHILAESYLVGLYRRQ
ncbi:MAG: YbhB/YbcL family Raf kinase inhibitor-like protein [Patescibacteria group bacterium]|jgi:Raf kinase inhibitor-like YbhB/YbcL family protein|nr:YbhB/YbcL family Raf kinase inhibitor-like protein [Patescibacteria group bacterium]